MFRIRSVVAARQKVGSTYAAREKKPASKRTRARPASLFFCPVVDVNRMAAAPFITCRPSCAFAFGVSLTTIFQ